ncbi:MAG: hypothetical protein ACR2MN_13240 [Acidimicrobiales bacterium]
MPSEAVGELGTEGIVTDARAEAGLIVARAHSQARATLEEADQLAREVHVAAHVVRQETAAAANMAVAEAQGTLTEVERLRQDLRRRSALLQRQEVVLCTILERLITDRARTDRIISEATRPGSSLLGGGQVGASPPTAGRPHRRAPSLSTGDAGVVGGIIRRLRRAVSVEVGFSTGATRESVDAHLLLRVARFRAP